LNSYRFRIRFQDRVGMARDVAAAVAGYEANIVSLEVRPGEMYMQLDQVPDSVLADIVRQVGLIPDVREAAPVRWLPRELNEQRLRAIFDAVEEGIVIADQGGFITMSNEKAADVLGPGRPLIGLRLQEAGFPPEIAGEIMSGRLKQQEVPLKTAGGSVRCLVKSKSIFDDHGKPEGSMITFDKMSRVRRLAHFITQPVMVTFEDISHNSAAMSEAVNLARTVAGGNSTILIRGESGAGKELFARAIHMASSRAENPYVVVNCAAIPDTLFESELFGYADGTFTGGLKGGRQGLFEFAHTGTIFLDEIAEIPPYIQAKLLRVLQEGCVRRLGEMLENRVDVRIIAATSRDLARLVASGSFREDLFYRLNVIPIHIPPLRRRKEEIPSLAWSFINKFNQRLGKQVASISGAALERLRAYDWPGNVRELENAIERAVNLTTGETLEARHIILPETRAPRPAGAAAGEQPEQVHARGGVDAGSDLKRAAAEAEKTALIDALHRGGSIRKAAKILGVSHTTVINKMRLYGLSASLSG
jgi:transcriptional regulator with PAS, ATPase and Fis domain